MQSASVLIGGVFLVIVMLAITSAIIALAPYIAGAVVIVGLFWFTFRSLKPQKE